MSNKEEYYGYVKDVKKSSFKKRLLMLKKKYKNKKVVLYGAGVFFDAIADVYNLNDYFDIVAVGDLRYEKQPIATYKGFTTCLPEEIKTLKPDVVIVSNVSPTQIFEFFERFEMLSLTTLLDSFVSLESNLGMEAMQSFYIALKMAFTGVKISDAIKYMRCCTVEEMQSKFNYQRVLSRLRKKKEKLRVLFVCEESAKWGYQSVYDLMAKNDNFEILPIIAFPVLVERKEIFSQQQTINFFKTMGIEAIDGYDAEKSEFIDLRQFSPDIIFHQQHWYSLKKRSPASISEYALNCVVSYGLTSVGDLLWGTTVAKNFCGNLWKMFAESEYHKKFYENATNLKNKDILEVKGYPKLDFYRESINEKFEKMWKDENKPEKHRIIWAPHHSVEKYGFGMSTFIQQKDFFIELAKKHPEYHFIVKPHPGLRVKCKYADIMTEDEYDEYMQSWNELPNGTVYDDGNYFDIFKTSDVLVTDSSSFLGEYYVSEKPIILIDTGERLPLNDFGENISKGFYYARSSDDIESLLYKLLIEKDDNLKPLRMQILKDNFYIPSEGVGQRIVSYIEKELRRV